MSSPRRARLTDDDISTVGQAHPGTEVPLQGRPANSGPSGSASPITKYSKSRISCNGPHLALAEKAAVESMVLLKNDNAHPADQAVGHEAGRRRRDGALRHDERMAHTQTGGIVNFALDVRTGDLGSSRVYHDPDQGRRPVRRHLQGGRRHADRDHGRRRHEDGDLRRRASITRHARHQHETDIAPVMTAAADADFVVVVAGLTAEDEGEEYTLAGDRREPRARREAGGRRTGRSRTTLIAAVAALASRWWSCSRAAASSTCPGWRSVPAVVMAWYPGQRGGAAMAKLLWGQENFSAKLPFTWGKRVEDYDIWNGNRHDDARLLRRLQLVRQQGHRAAVSVRPRAQLHEVRVQEPAARVQRDEPGGGAARSSSTSTNTGTVAGDEVVMVWTSYPEHHGAPSGQGAERLPRVHLAAGEEKQITIPVRLSDLDYFKVEDSVNADRQVGRRERPDQGHGRRQLRQSPAAPRPSTSTVTRPGSAPERPLTTNVYRMDRMRTPALISFDSFSCVLRSGLRAGKRGRAAPISSRLSQGARRAGFAGCSSRGAARAARPPVAPAAGASRRCPPRRRRLTRRGSAVPPLSGARRGPTEPAVHHRGRRAARARVRLSRGPGSPRSQVLVHCG